MDNAPLNLGVQAQFRLGWGTATAILLGSLSFGTLGGLVSKANFGSEFWAAIIGALVGGAITAAIQWITVIAERKARALDVKSQREATGLMCLIKAKKIYDDLRQYSWHLECQFSEIPSDGASDPFLHICPLGQIPLEILFMDNEIVLIHSLGDMDLLNSIISLAERHRIMSATMATYLEKRIALLEVIPIGLRPKIGSIDRAQPALSPYVPRMEFLDTMVIEARDNAFKHAAEAEICVDLLNIKLNNLLNLNLVIKPSGNLI